MFRYEREPTNQELSGEDISLLLRTVTNEARHRLESRLLLEEQNIPLTNTPIGGEEGLEGVLSFIPTAKEGFALHLKAQDLDSDKIGDLVKETSTSITSINDELKRLGISIKPYLVEVRERLALFRHSLATITFLSEKGSFASSGIIDLEDLESTYQLEQFSFWPARPTTEDVWILLNEIGDATSQMIWDDNNLSQKDRQSALRATHFFEVGSILTSVI